MKRFVFTLLIVLLSASSAPAAKYDLGFASGTTNDIFAKVSREAGIMTAYRGVAPAEPQGIKGFDIGVAVNFAEIDSDLWEQAVGTSSTDYPGYLPIPKIQVRKGLPYNFDIGASYAKVPSSNLTMVGGELQWALLEGSTATPAVAVRGSYSSLGGVDDIELSTYAADLVVSKGFAMLTPYAGAGVVRINAEYTGDDALLKTTLNDYSATELRYFGGVQMSMALVRLTIDAEFGELPVYTAKLSLGW